MSKIKRYLEDLEAEIEEVFNDVDFDEDVMETMIMNLDRQKRKEKNYE